MDPEEALVALCPVILQAYHLATIPDWIETCHRWHNAHPLSQWRCRWQQCRCWREHLYYSQHLLSWAVWTPQPPSRRPFLLGTGTPAWPEIFAPWPSSFLSLFWVWVSCSGSGFLVLGLGFLFWVWVSCSGCGFLVLGVGFLFCMQVFILYNVFNSQFLIIVLEWPANKAIFIVNQSPRYQAPFNKVLIFFFAELGILITWEFVSNTDTDVLKKCQFPPLLAQYWSTHKPLRRLGYPCTLCLSRLKPEETVVEVRCDSDVQINRLHADRKRKAFNDVDYKLSKKRKKELNW